MKWTRVEKVMRGMEAAGLSQMLVTAPASVFYLTGCWIEPDERMLALLLRADGKHRFFLNTLFDVPEDIGITLDWHGDVDDGPARIAAHIDRDGVLAVDKLWPSHFLLRLMALRGDAGFVNGSPVVDAARMVKDAEEIACMRTASRLNDAAMGRLIEQLRKGPSERALAKFLEDTYFALGADGPSFPPIVSYGVHGAIAHNTPLDTPPAPGDAVILDIGCVKDHYCSDMTRTPFYGHATQAQRDVYAVALEATMAGIDAVAPGVRLMDVDAAARGVVEKAGYGDGLIDRVGHMIGLDVHDFGSVSRTNAQVCEPGMIFSMEPGITIRGQYAVRVEDLVLVTETGHERLNDYPHELLVIQPDTGEA